MIGFLPFTVSYDKDGVRSAAVFYELAASLYSQQTNCAAHLQSLYQRYGFFHSHQSYFIVNDRTHADAIFARLRDYQPTGGGYPKQCKHFAIDSVRDVTLGKDTSSPDGRSALPTDPSSQMVTFRFANGSVATLRNSGTEPNLKWYLECFDAQSAANAEKLVAEMGEAIVSEFIQPEKYGLMAKS